MLTLTKKEKMDLNIVEIARRVREQLKSDLPDYKFSVRIDRYSMGQALDIFVMSGPIEAYVLGHDGLRPVKYYTPECKALIDQIKGIANQYNWDDSDSMTDYHDVHFMLSVGIGRWPKEYIKTI